ncbi:phage tail tape measure protein [Jeongeupia wiesaeckerbachi]|uniref:phage tail tape measure protein n=1 Tax=Jeongeupia wiesaeckerbachi TaxID=3051218 RepID=UPI003D80756C
MSNEVLVGIKIGALLSGSFQSVFASARSTTLRLGQAATEVSAKHARLGEVMARAMAHPGRNISALRRQYEQLGQTLDQLRAKQERLTASLARGAALKSARGELRSEAMETVGTAVALGAPVLKSVQLAAGFQDQLRDTAITGEFSKAEEASLGKTMRKSALDWNQTQAEVARGTGVLVAGGIQNARELEKYAPVMAKSATATRASMDDLGAVALAMKDNLNIGADGYEGAMNMLAYAGKRGQVEIRDMAKFLPQIAPSFQAMGVTGKEAVAEIGAALQIARKGAGSNDEAANNFRNFLQKLTAPETLKDFANAGIDLKTSMQTLRSQGFTPVEAMLKVITQYLGTKSPEAADRFIAAMNIKDDKERQVAVGKLQEAYKLGELFQDMQAMNFIRPAIANQGEMQDIKKGSIDAADKGLIDKDYAKRTETAVEHFKAFKISMMDIGITIGEALLPTINELLRDIKPAISAFGEWAKAHPVVIKGVIGLVGGLLAGKMAFIALRYGINLVLSPFNALTSAVTALSGKWTLLRAFAQRGGFAPALSVLRGLGGGFMAVGRALLPFARGMAMAFGSPLILAARGVLFLGKLLAGNLVGGLRLVGQAVLWIGRAMLMNPIGLAITGIAIAAYLIYRYWSPIKQFFSGLWAEVKTAFAGGIGGVARLILNWSPVGLFYKAFAGVMKWFGVDMPKTFTDFGGHLIGGLINGIKAKFGAAKEAIVGFGQDIKGWFSSTLGIQSPSRVFMGFGDNIAQGAAIGIGRSSGLASKAAGSMAAQTAAAAAAKRLGAGRASAAGPAGAAGGGMTIHFSPHITVPPGSPQSVKDAVQQGLQLSLHELEQLIGRVTAQQARRAY